MVEIASPSTKKRDRTQKYAAYARYGVPFYWIVDNTKQVLEELKLDPWAIGLGAYIYFGSLAVGVSSGSAFIFAALAAFAIFIFVRVCGEPTPPLRHAPRRRPQPRTSRD